MKTLLALFAAVFTVSAWTEEWKWLQTQVAMTAFLYDGTGGTFEFEPGDVFPASRVLNPEELDADQRAEFPVAPRYLVIPLVSKNCAVAPTPDDPRKLVFVDPLDPALTAKVIEWHKFDAELAATAAKINAAREAETVGGAAGPSPMPGSGRKTEKEWRQEAVRQFPDLGISGTSMNTLFLSEYEKLRVSSSEFFNQPDWPVLLGRRCFRLLNSPDDPTPVPPATEGVSGGTIPQTSSATPKSVPATASPNDPVTSRLEAPWMLAVGSLFFSVFPLFSLLAALWMGRNRDNQYRAANPDGIKFHWGYSFGYWLVLMPLVLIFAILGKANVNGGEVVGVIFVSGLLYVPAGMMILRRRSRGAFVFGTLATLNPVVWIINGIYLKKVWSSLAKTNSTAPPIDPAVEAKFPTLELDEAIGNSPHSLPEAPHDTPDNPSHVKTFVAILLAVWSVCSFINGLRFLGTPNFGGSPEPVIFMLISFAMSVASFLGARKLIKKKTPR